MSPEFADHQTSSKNSRPPGINHHLYRLAIFSRGAYKNACLVMYIIYYIHPLQQDTTFSLSSNNNHSEHLISFIHTCTSYTCHDVRGSTSGLSITLHRTFKLLVCLKWSPMFVIYVSSHTAIECYWGLFTSLLLGSFGYLL